MSNEVRNRVAMTAGVSLVAAAIVAVLFGTGVNTWDRANRAQPSLVYHEATSRAIPLESNIEWLEPSSQLARVPTDDELEHVARDWASMWFTIDGVRSNEVVADPDETVTAGALERLERNQPMLSGVTVRQIKHRLRVSYYSSDGAVMGLEVPHALSQLSFPDSVTDYPLEMEQVAAYSAMITLTDGRWRLVALRSDPPPASEVR